MAIPEEREIEVNLLFPTKLYKLVLFGLSTAVGEGLQT